jgi:adenosylhomocysteinase
MYHLENSQLRVCGKWLRQERNKSVIAKTRFILLQHILPTTEELVNLLREAGGEIFSVFAKPYSIDHDVLSRMRASGVDIIEKSYAELEETDFLDRHLGEAVAKSKHDGKRVVILEVGGYFAKPLTRLDANAAEHIAGVVEDTTFGHNRYLGLAASIPVPVVSVARSELKEIEARFVGQDAVIAMDYVLRLLGVSITNRKALVRKWVSLNCAIFPRLMSAPQTAPVGSWDSRPGRRRVPSSVARVPSAGRTAPRLP